MYNCKKKGLSNDLDLDQDSQNEGPDLGPNGLHSNRVDQERSEIFSRRMLFMPLYHLLTFFQNTL